MNSVLGNKKFIVFGVEHYNPLGLVRSLGEKGIRPIVIVLKNKTKITSKSKYISKLHIVEDIDDGYKVLLNYIHVEDKPFVLTADDKVTCYLDNHYDELKDKCYFFNAGEQSRISHYINKANIMECAKKHGLKVLDSVVVKKGEIPENLSYPIITKAEDPTVGAWKGDMFICNSEKELQAAYSKIESPYVILQKYIEKNNEYCMEGFSINQGKNMVITIASTYNYLIDISYSPYMTVGNFERYEIKPALDQMFEEIGFEGIFEIEFLVDKNGEMYFGEINFRNSTWSYASTCVDMNLPYLWASSTLQEKIDSNYYKKVPAGFTAMVELADFKYRVLGKKINILNWIKEFVKSDCKYYIGRNDLGAFLGMLFSKIF